VCVATLGVLACIGVGVYPAGCKETVRLSRSGTRSSLPRGNGRAGGCGGARARTGLRPKKEGIPFQLRAGRRDDGAPGARAIVLSRGMR
jgi:hypothetical protein